MKIVKCDICKKVIWDVREKTTIFLPGFSTHELCEACTKLHLGSVIKALGRASHKAEKAAKK